MSRKTFAELRTYGGAIGGNDAIDDWIKTKMNAWLRKHYAAYAWPFLIVPAAGTELSAGSVFEFYGAGENSISHQISRIFSPIYYRVNGSFSGRGKANVRQIVGGLTEVNPTMVDSATERGRPQSFIVTPIQESDGLMKVALYPYPIPDQTYILSFVYQRLPDDLEDNEIPEYPNEMTLIQACKVAAIEYDRSATQLHLDEVKILSEMVAADRDTYGGTSSFGDTLQLDSSVFK